MHRAAGVLVRAEHAVRVVVRRRRGIAVVDRVPVVVDAASGARVDRGARSSVAALTPAAPRLAQRPPTARIWRPAERPLPSVTAPAFARSGQPTLRAPASALWPVEPARSTASGIARPRRAGCACLVDDFVDRLVQLERAQQRSAVARVGARRRGVAVAERRAVALGPLSAAPVLVARASGRAGPTPELVGPRSRTSAACPATSRSGESGAPRSASGLAGSPSKSISSQPSAVRSTWPRCRSPWTRCTAIRLGDVGQPRRTTARIAGDVRRQLGHRRPAARVEPLAPARPRELVGSRSTSVPSARRSSACTAATASPSRYASAGEVAADLVGAQVALGHQVAHAGGGHRPAVGARWRRTPAASPSVVGSPSTSPSIAPSGAATCVAAAPAAAPGAAPGPGSGPGASRRNSLRIDCVAVDDRGVATARRRAPGPRAASASSASGSATKPQRRRRCAVAGDQRRAATPVDVGSAQRVVGARSPSTAPITRVLAARRAAAAAAADQQLVALHARSPSANGDGDQHDGSSSRRRRRRRSVGACCDRTRRPSDRRGPCRANQRCVRQPLGQQRRRHRAHGRPDGRGHIASVGRRDRRTSRSRAPAASAGRAARRSAGTAPRRSARAARSPVIAQVELHRLREPRQVVDAQHDVVVVRRRRARRPAPTGWSRRARGTRRAPNAGCRLRISIIRAGPVQQRRRRVRSAPRR